MTDILIDRGLIGDSEAERLMFGGQPGAEGPTGDEALMLRAALTGATFTPVYGDRSLWSPAPPEMTGYALRTLADVAPFMMPARNGLPVLTDEARAALRRQTEGAATR